MCLLDRDLPGNFFDVNADLSADFDMLLRLYLNECPIKYLSTTLSYMRSGGESNASLRKILFYNNKDIIDSCRENGIKTNPAILWIRFPYKLIEIFNGLWIRYL